MKNIIEIILKAIDQASPVIKKSVKDIERSNKQLVKSNELSGKSFKMVSGSVIAASGSMKKASSDASKASENTKKAAADYNGMALAASATFAALSYAIRDVVNESEEMNNSLIGLSSVAEGVGIDAEKAKNAAKELADDGLMSVADAATSLKNLLNRGFSLDQAINLMNRFKDSAAFGRQASLGFGEAIRGATEGLKNENSVLVDNAGVTKNVSKMWEEYAQKLGKGAKSLTQAEKLQAEYNGIMKETRFQVGDANKLINELSGELSKAAAETKMAKAELGDNLKPVLRELLSELTPLISEFREFNREQPKIASSLLTGTTAASGMAATLSILAVAVRAVGVAIGGFTGHIGIAIIALTSFTALIAGVRTALAQERLELEKAKKAKIEHTKEVIKLGDEYKSLKNKYDDVNTSAEEKEEIEKRLREIAGKLQESTNSLKGAYDAQKDSIEKLTEAQDKLVENTASEINSKLANAKATLKLLEAENERFKLLAEQMPEADYAYQIRINENKTRVKKLYEEINQLNDTLWESKGWKEKATRTTKKDTEAVKENTDAVEENKETQEEAAKAAKEARRQQIDEINRLNDSLQSALRKRYEQQERMQVNALEKELELARKTTEEKIGLYNKEYLAKLKALDAEKAAAIEKIESQIDAINEQTEAEEKALEEREMKERIASLEAKLLAAKDADEKARIQEELNQELEEQRRRRVLDEREAQKEALRLEIEKIREQAENKKNLLQEEYEAKKQAEQAQLDATIERLNNEKTEIQNHYSRLKEEAELAAQAQQMIWDNNQKEILELIKTYEPDFVDQGKSFGERMLEGFKSVNLAQMIGGIIGNVPRTGAGPSGGSVSGGGSGGSSGGSVSNDHLSDTESNQVKNDARIALEAGVIDQDIYDSVVGNLDTAHTGGKITKNGVIPMSQLKDDEVPIIAKEGEIVINPDLPLKGRTVGNSPIILNLSFNFGTSVFSGSKLDFKRFVQTEVVPVVSQAIGRTVLTNRKI